MNDEVARAALVAALDLFEFDAVHIHNLIGHSLAPLDALADFPGPVVLLGARPVPRVPELLAALQEERSVRHPRGSLGVRALPRRHRRVADAGLAADAERLASSTSTSSARRSATRLDTVDHWVFPSQSAADYFLRVYEPDPARMEIIEHGSVIRLGRRPAEPDEQLLRDEPLRVAFVGLGWSKKGLDAVNELAEAFRDSSVEIHHFGPLKQPASPELHAHGAYDNELLPDLLHRAGIQVVLLPGRVRRDVRDRDERGAGGGHPGDRRAATARSASASARTGRLDDRPHRSRGHPVADRAPRPGARRAACASHVRCCASRCETVAETAHRYAALYRR